jgi:hypothetical protein
MTGPVQKFQIRSQPVGEQSGNHPVAPSSVPWELQVGHHGVGGPITRANASAVSIVTVSG